MSAYPTPPEQLKSIKPYLTLATQLDAKDEIAVGYYCRTYAFQSGMTVNKSSPECKKFLLQIMDTLEKTKAQNKGNETIQSEVAGQAYVESYALGIFETADDDDRHSRFSKNLVKQFYTAGLLFDILNYFGELSEDLIAKKQYAKYKAMYLNKCLTNGETPVPGPLSSGGNNEDDQDSLPTQPSASNTASHHMPTYHNSEPSPQKPTNYEPSAPRISSGRASNHQEPMNNDYMNSQIKTNEFPPELLQKAQKCCKYATSALQYEDIGTAISNLEECLRILKRETK